MTDDNPAQLSQKRDFVGPPARITREPRSRTEESDFRGNDTGGGMANTTNRAPTRDLVFTRVFDAPVEHVWKAWIEPELIMLGGGGSTVFSREAGLATMV